jgi:hypothetical protein
MVRIAESKNREEFRNGSGLLKGKIGRSVEMDQDW